jgi:hypothetical protein
LEATVLAMKRSTEWLVLLLFWAIVFAIERTILSDVRHGDPIRIWVMICVTVTFWLGYMLYLWRPDISGFLKRVLIAIPFALLFAVFMIILTRTLAISVSALSVYLFLTYKTPSWKQHFSVTLILASILAVALKFSYAILNPLIPQEMSIYRNFFYMVSIVFVVFFYGVYLRKVKDGETVDLRVILIRMLKFITAFSLYTAAWLTLEQFSERDRISLPVNLMVSGVLTIAFLAIIYLFDLMPIERKKKKSKLDELQSQLNDVYLKEREKSSSD